MTMRLDNEDEPPIVNAFDFYRSYGLSEHTAISLVLHMLLTRSYCLEADAREAALEMNITLPYVFPDNGRTH